MVAQLLGLKLHLLANSFRRSFWPVFALIVGILYGIAIAVTAVGGLIAARFAVEPETMRVVLIIIGSVVVIGFALLPVVIGTDDTMDPRSFGLFGMDDRRLAFALAVTALTGIPTVVLAIAVIGSLVTWSENIGTVLVALVGGALLVATCSLLARITTSLSAFLLSTRRSREFTGLIGIVVLLLLFPLAVLLASVDWSAEGPRVAGSLADVLGWTPLGAAVGAPGDAAVGAWGGALVKLLVAAATVAVLWWAWQALVARMLVTPQREASTKSYTSTGWFGRLPGTPAWAIAARSLTYWARDSRYWIGLVPIPFVAAIVVVALSIVGVPAATVALIPLPVMCLMLGWTIHDDVAYDSTAIWLHIVSGAGGAADRVGRMVPVVLIAVPLIALGSVVTAATHGDFDVLPAVIGVCTALVLVGLGLSSITSALLPYPVTRPGDSPFQQPQSTGATAALVQAVSFLAIVVLASPTIVLGILGVFDDATLIIPALVSGVAIGLVVLAVGIAAGSAIYRRRQPEILAFAVRAD